MLQKLEKQFIGVGEVKGFIFTQIASTEFGYVYEVDTGNSKHYEVFRRVNSPLCIDFKERIYSKNDFRETYPKSNSFGVWSWWYPKLHKAEEKLYSIVKKEAKNG